VNGYRLTYLIRSDNTEMKRTSYGIAFAIAVLMLVVSVTTEAAEIASVQYTRYGLIYEGSAAGVKKGDVFKVIRDEMEIGVFVANSVSRDVTNGEFIPDIESYLPLKKGDALVRVENYQISDKVLVVESQDDEQQITDKKGFNLIIPTTAFTQGMSASVEYQPIGTIGQVSTYGYTVKADVVNYIFNAAFDDSEFSYVRQDCTLNAYSVLGKRVSDGDADKR